MDNNVNTEITLHINNIYESAILTFFAAKFYSTVQFKVVFVKCATRSSFEIYHKKLGTGEAKNGLK